MKKVFAILMLAVLLATFTIPAFAYDLKSPTQPTVPTIKEEIAVDDQGQVIYEPGTTTPVKYRATIVSADQTRTKVKVQELEDYAVSESSEGASEVEKELIRANQELQTMDFTKLEDIQLSAESIGAPLNTTVFVCTHVFDIEIVEQDKIDLLSEDKAYIIITFSLKLAEDELKPTVIHKNMETGKWDVVPRDNTFYDAAKEEFTVYFDHLCPIAFLSVNLDNLVIDAEANHVLCNLVILCIILFFVILIIIIILLLTRRNGRKDDDDQVAPIAPITETKVEEPKAEEPVTEEPAGEDKVEEANEEAEEVEEEPKAEETVAPKKGEAIELTASGFAALSDAEKAFVHYRRSYSARLSQATDKCKAYYNELKNTLLAIRSVKCRKAWGSETFTKGKVKFAKFVMKGKTLVVFFGIDANRYDEKYRIEDVTKPGKETKYPAKMKISSNRALGYAHEIIETIRIENDLKINKKYVAEDYIPEYLNQQQLIEAGYVKVMYTKPVEEGTVVEVANIKEYIYGEDNK